MDAYEAAAFCHHENGGNMAGVVVGENNLTYSQKKHIAGEFGYSETAFVTDSDAADFKIEYFTPTDEVPLCGHATIAAFSILKELGGSDVFSYKIETKSGILKIDVEEDGMIFMEQNNPAFYDVMEKEELAGCFDMAVPDTGLSAQIVSTGLKDILTPVSTREKLDALNPDFDAIAATSRKYDVIGIHVFALTDAARLTSSGFLFEADDENGLTAYCRNFAPLYGINEEAATGTSNCALACYLFKNGFRQKRYVFEQGHKLNSISRITVLLDSEGEDITRVRVGGHARMVCRKYLSDLL